MDWLKLFAAKSSNRIAAFEQRYYARKLSLFLWHELEFLKFLLHLEPCLPCLTIFMMLSLRHSLSQLCPMSSKLPLSGVVITKNEADRIVRCVTSLLKVCQEVIVLDSGSTDDTVRLARETGARVEHQDWLGFSAQKNAVIELANQPWIFLLDADEWCEDKDIEQLRSLMASPQFESADVWNCQRQTYFLGKSLAFGGREKEPVERVFRNSLRYLPAQVHEKLDLKNRIVKAANIRIQHDTARSYREFSLKLDSYAALFAEQNIHKATKAYAGQAGIHAFFYLLKNYIFRGGFLDGKQGFYYHWLHARYVWMKYTFLADKARITQL
jgi:(heptosyl)LPS beta-1,4-glucosyltransferase